MLHPRLTLDLACGLAVSAGRGLEQASCPGRTALPGSLEDTLPPSARPHPMGAPCTGEAGRVLCEWAQALPVRTTASVHAGPVRPALGAAVTHPRASGCGNRWAAAGCSKQAASVGSCLGPLLSAQCHLRCPHVWGPCDLPVPALPCSGPPDSPGVRTGQGPAQLCPSGRRLHRPL